MAAAPKHTAKNKHTHTAANMASSKDIKVKIACIMIYASIIGCFLPIIEQSPCQVLKMLKITQYTMNTTAYKSD
jgi:hypothetical protein